MLSEVFVCPQGGGKGTVYNVTSYLGGLCEGGLCERRVSVKGVFVKGGLCEGGPCERSVSVKGVFVKGGPCERRVSVKGVFVKGGICEGGSVRRPPRQTPSPRQTTWTETSPPDRDPPTSNQNPRVRILLECILVV